MLQVIFHRVFEMSATKWETIVNVCCFSFAGHVVRRAEALGGGVDDCATRACRVGARPVSQLTTSFPKCCCSRQMDCTL